MLRLLLPMLLVAAPAAARPRNPLFAAGFVSRPANTALRQAMLVRLPVHQFVRQVHGRREHVAFADPGGCDCLYVGSPGALRRYARLTGTRPWVAEYHDLFWDWDRWGGFGPGFHWGPGMGW